MKYFKFGFYSLAEKPWFNLLIMAELAAILFVGNLMIAVANSRMVYYEPYAELMQHEGFVYTPKAVMKEEYRRRLTEGYAALQGDVKVTMSGARTMMSDSELLTVEKDSKGTSYRVLYTFDDSVYKKFNLPLSKGRWGASQRNSRGQIEAVALLESETNLKVGDVIPFRIGMPNESGNDITEKDMGELLIVGTIKHGKNFPVMSMTGITNGSNGKKMTKDVRNMYSAGAFGNEAASFIVSSAVDPELQKVLNPELSTAFITYNTEPTESERQANKELLAGLGGTVLSMKDFKRSSDSYLYEQYIKLLPVIAGVFLIVLTELICSAAMHTKRQMRNFGIYYLCGCRWKDCLKITLTYSLFILLGAAVLGAAALLIFSHTSYAQAFEQNINVNNLIISAAIVLFMLAVSFILPAVMVGRTSPVATIKEV